MEAKPKWLKKKIKLDDDYHYTSFLLEQLGVNTVCMSAHCPNLPECFAQKTATFMILGKYCTRSCRFCAIENVHPERIDEEEPQKIAFAVNKLGLKHVVITSVTRDDLNDGGAFQFCNVVNLLKKLDDSLVIELLTPDFNGNQRAIQEIVNCEPHIYNHNIETVPYLYDKIRPEADYAQSLRVLRYVKHLNQDIYTKSGLMLGMGEKKEAVFDVIRDLRDVKCDILTVGQYLAPSNHHYPVREYISPSFFDEIERFAYDLGFKYIFSGPFVRSSYHAAEFSKNYL